MANLPPRGLQVVMTGTAEQHGGRCREHCADTRQVDNTRSGTMPMKAAGMSCPGKRACVDVCVEVAAGYQAAGPGVEGANQHALGIGSGHAAYGIQIRQWHPIQSVHCEHPAQHSGMLTGWRQCSS